MELENTKADEPNFNWPSGAVRKTVFSSKLRLLAAVGMEGTGHHFFELATRLVIHIVWPFIHVSTHFTSPLPVVDTFVQGGLIGVTQYSVVLKKLHLMVLRI